MEETLYEMTCRVMLSSITVDRKVWVRVLTRWELTTPKWALET